MPRSGLLLAGHIVCSRRSSTACKEIAMATTTLSRPRNRIGDRAAVRWPAEWQRTNVGPTERLVSLIGGGTLFLYGLSRRSTGGLWLSAAGAALAYRGATGHCQCYEALGVSTAGHAPQTAIPSGQGMKLEESVTVLRPSEDLSKFWRKFENLPRVMEHLVCGEEQD